MKKSQNTRALFQCVLCALYCLGIHTPLTAQTPAAPEPSTNTAATAEPSATNTAPDQKTHDAPRTRIDPNKEHLALLAEEIDDGARQWIDANSGKFLAVWEPNKSGKPFGAVLLLHGNGESTESPHTLQALRDNLSHHGWATLAISLPPLAPPKIPPRASITEPHNEKDSSGNTKAVKSNAGQSSSVTDPEHISNERLHAAMAYLNRQGQFNIVAIGHGLGALRAARFIDSFSANAASKSTAKSDTSASNRPVRAFIMIEARNQIPSEDAHIGDYLNDPSLPILDIYYGDHYLDSLHVEQRRNHAREKQIKEYFQVKVMRPTTSDDSSENRLTRRVRGFLSQHAKGVAVERKRGG